MFGAWGWVTTMEEQEPMWQSRWWQTGKGSEQAKLPGPGREEDKDGGTSRTRGPWGFMTKKPAHSPLHQVANEPFYRWRKRISRVSRLCRTPKSCTRAFKAFCFGPRHSVWNQRSLLAGNPRGPWQVSEGSAWGLTRCELWGQPAVCAHSGESEWFCLPVHTHKRVRLDPKCVLPYLTSIWWVTEHSSL